MNSQTTIAAMRAPMMTPTGNGGDDAIGVDPADSVILSDINIAGSIGGDSQLM